MSDLYIRQESSRAKALTRALTNRCKEGDLSDSLTRLVQRMDLFPGMSDRGEAHSAALAQLVECSALNEAGDLVVESLESGPWGVGPVEPWSERSGVFNEVVSAITWEILRRLEIGIGWTEEEFDRALDLASRPRRRPERGRR